MVNQQMLKLFKLLTSCRKQFCGFDVDFQLTYIVWHLAQRIACSLVGSSSRYDEVH